MTEEIKKDITNDVNENEEVNETAETPCEENDGGEKLDRKEKKEVKKLKTELEEANKKLDEQNDKYLRLAAEYDNFRKRTQTERKNIYGDAVSDTLAGLLPIIDNLQIAAKYSSQDSEKLAEGLSLILSKLPETLEKLDIKAFGESGETFDPTLHNAVMHVEDESYGEGEIVDVLQQGYMYGERVIRYAMVKVAN